MQSSIKYDHIGFVFSADLTSGTSRDYVYLAENITYPYTIEARDRTYGFVAPASEILPTAEEIWNGIKAMANAVV